MQQQVLLKIKKKNDQLYYFPPKIAYKLIKAGRSEDILQVQGLSWYIALSQHLK